MHAVDFLSQTQVLSAANDGTLKVWDVHAETAANTFEHADHVRSLAVSPDSPFIVYTGCYDHCIRTWDTRLGECVQTYNHEAPVESILVFPGSRQLASSGSNTVRIWDTLMCAAPTFTVSPHAKTITHISLANSNKNMVTASLDRQVKVCNIATGYEVEHTFKYPHSILSFAISVLFV